MATESNVQSAPGVRTYRGRTLEEILPQIREELGPDAIILREREGLVGGVGGFFAQRFIEVEARRGDGQSIDIYDDAPESTWAISPRSDEAVTERQQPLLPEGQPPRRGSNRTRSGGADGDQRAGARLPSRERSTDQNRGRLIRRLCSANGSFPGSRISLNRHLPPADLRPTYSSSACAPPSAILPDEDEELSEPGAAASALSRAASASTGCA